MKQIVIALTAGLLGACGAPSEQQVSDRPAATLQPAANPISNESEPSMTEALGEAHQASFTTIDGKPLPFSSFAGQVVLVVNTASQCGYTGQYAGLQELYDTFKADGFAVLGVPSNDFGAQEPGTEAQIATFCELNYGVEFPLTRKTTVVGADQHELWGMAKDALGDKAEPKWNFHKVLVSRDGKFLQAYPSAVRPSDAELVADIERALGAES
ncbi:MAG: glutathione peroxidase [Pseudomonadota bacterium]